MYSENDNDIEYNIKQRRFHTIFYLVELLNHFNFLLIVYLFIIFYLFLFILIYLIFFTKYL